MKKFLIVSLVMVGVLSVPLFFLAVNLDDLVKRSIERSGSRVLGTEVSVREVTLETTQGRGTLHGLTVANPLGYSEQPALTLGEIEVAYDFESGTINQVRISQAQARVELRGSSSNYQDLADHARAYDPPDSQQDPQDTLRINLLVLEESRAVLSTDFSDRQLEFTVDELRLNGLEGTRGEIAARIGRALAEHLLREAAAQALKARALDKAEEWTQRLRELTEG